MSSKALTGWSKQQQLIMLLQCITVQNGTQKLCCHSGLGVGGER